MIQKQEHLLGDTGSSRPSSERTFSNCLYRKDSCAPGSTPRTWHRGGRVNDPKTLGLRQRRGGKQAQTYGQEGQQEQTRPCGQRREETFRPQGLWQEWRRYFWLFEPWGEKARMKRNGLDEPLGEQDRKWPYEPLGAQLKSENEPSRKEV